MANLQNTVIAGSLRLSSHGAGMVRTSANGTISSSPMTSADLPSHTHDDRYYTESESDARFLIGTTSPGSVNNFTISIGNNGSYSYVQSHSGQPLYLNPVGNAIRLNSTTTIDASLTVTSNTTWFSGTAQINLENQSTFARFAFYGLDFYDWDHGVQMTLNNNYVYVSNYLQAGDSLRAPRFYDSNDTGYYGDFASTSVMNSIRFGTSSNNSTLSGTSDWGVKFQTDHGWIRIGPANSSYAHIYTDRGNFYFNVDTLYANGATVLTSSNYSSWAQPASSALNTSNWASYAAPRAYVTDSYVDFYIYGDQNKYYPVTIHNWNGGHGMQRYSVSRGYSWSAPWDPIGTGSHQGGLTFTFEWAGDIAWGGNDKSIRVIEFSETYTTMVAGMQLAHCEGVVVWLRGGGSGGAHYRLHGPGGRSQTYSINMSAWTSCAGINYPIRDHSGTVMDSEVWARYPIRFNGDDNNIYLNNNLVATRAWVQAQGYRTTDSDSQTLSISGSTLSISGGNSVTIPSGGMSQATADGLYVNVTGDTMSGTLDLPRMRIGGNVHDLEASEGVIRMGNNQSNHNYLVSNGAGWGSWNQWIRYVANYNTWRIGTFDAAQESGDSMWRLAGRNRSSNSELNYIVAGPRGAWGSDDRVILWNPKARYDGGSYNGDGTHHSLLPENKWWNSKYFGSDGAIYGAVFYDSDDSNYYLNPHTSSRLRYLYIGDSGSSWSNPGGWDTTLYISGVNHSIIRVENRQNNYHSALHSHVGQLPGVGSPGDYDFRITRNWSDRMIFYNGYTYATGYLQAADSLRAPIFYDSNDTNYYVDPNSNSYLSRLRVADASGGVSLSVGNGSTHGVYTADNARKYLVVAGDYYPHMALVASGANNTNHGAVFSFVGSEGGAFRQWNLGIANNNPFLFSIGYNRTTDPNPHYGVGDGWSADDNNHARLSIDRDGNTKIRGMLYVNGTSGGISTGSAVIHAGNIGSQSVSYATNSGNSATTSQRSFDYIYATSYLESAGGVYGTVFYDNNDRSYYLDPHSTSELRNLYLGAHDSGASEFLFGENSSGWYGMRWYWDSGVNFYWYGRNAGSDTLIMNYTTNDNTYVKWHRHFHMNNYEVNYVGQLHLNNGFALQQTGSYGYINNWLKIGTTGIFSDSNSAHIYPNTSTSYGSWRMDGSRSGWRGINFSGNVTLMMNDNETGFYRDGYGWQWRWENGTGYIHKNGQGGGTSATILDSSNWTSYVTSLQGYSAYNLVEEARGVHSGSDFPNGTLVTTDIYADGWSGDSFVMEVSGKSYDSSNSPFKLIMQGYLYADSIINVSAMSYGSYFPGPVKVMRYNGNIAFWWPRGSYWNSFQVHVRDAGGSSWNRVTGISNSSEPNGDKKISITPIQVLHTSNASYAYNMNQNVRTSDGVTFANVSANDIYTTGGWFRNHTNNNGIYWSNTGWHIYPASAGDLRMRADSSGTAALRMETSGGSVRGYFYANNGNEIGILSEDGNWVLRTWNRGVHAYGQMRSPIFYDSDDTTYYMDFNSTTSGRLRGNLIFNDYGAGIIGTYTSTRYQGVFSMGEAYKLPIDGSSTGNLYGLAWSHPNAGGVASNLNTHGLLVMENGTFLAAISGSIRARDDVRAPALYDSGSRVAISRGEGRNYVDYSRYVYNNGAYSGSGWVEPSDLGVRYAASANYATSAGSAGSVSWGNVSSKPAGWLDTTNLISDHAPNASATVSGFYQNYAGDGNPTGTWFNYINVRHSNPGNGHGFQLGMSYYDSHLWYRSYQGGTSPSFATWYRAYSDYYRPYADNSGALAGYGSSSYLNRNGTSYYQLDTWLQSTGTHGLYSTYNNFHLNPNADTSYTPARIYGSRNGYQGAVFGGADGWVHLMMNAGNWGIYEQGGFDWALYGSRNNYVTIGSSAVSHKLRVEGTIAATGDVIAYYSDARLKTDVREIENALDKVLAIRGVYYKPNDLSKQLGAESEPDKLKVGVLAQEIQAVLPEVIADAPFDIRVDKETGEKYSISGQNYMTVKYEKLVPLLIQAIKEQQKQIEELKSKLV